MTRPAQPESPQLQIRSTEDLLAVAPITLGFHPEESVVMLTFGGEQQFHARVDLPDSIYQAASPAEALVPTAVRHGVQKAAVLVYTERRSLARAVAMRLVERLLGESIGVIDAVRVEDDRWYAFDGPPYGGQPYDLSSHPMMAQAVFAGVVVEPRRSVLIAGLRPDEEARTRVAALVGERAAVGDDDVALQLREGQWVHDLVDHRLDDWAPFSDDDLARTLVGMRQLRVRDAGWAAVDRPRAAAAVDLWRDAVRRAPDELLAAPASLLAWSAWQSGNGALAWCALERCWEVTPDYSLSRLLERILAHGVAPSDWDGEWDWRSGARAG